MQECITIDVLRDYLAGLVAPDVSLSFETHLQNCAKCQSLVARFTPQPEPLLQAARGAVANSIEQEPELVSVLSLIGGFRSRAGGDSASISATQAAVAPIIRDYQILKKLGEGGMGTVYLALHTRLEKTVALKILKADRDRNPQAIARFEREMKAVGKLDHPHIVRALDAGDDDGTYFLVMEYIEGRDLGRLLQIKGRLRVPQACELIRQAALGLQHAHDNNLVHRDVKPSNLILSATGQVKVLDLGLAQLQVDADDSNELTREGQLVGTWLYMAPEQLSPDRQADSRSDIFSLGVTFYSFLVGELPLSRGQMATQLPAIGTQRADVPPDVQMLLEKMLSPNPDQRIQTMTEVARVLGIYATQVPGDNSGSSANSASAANRASPSITNTRTFSSTAEEPDLVSPPVQVPPPVALPAMRALDFSRRYWRHLAVAGAAVAALLVLVVVTNRPKSSPAKSTAGQGKEIIPNPPPVVPDAGKINLVLAQNGKAGLDPIVLSFYAWSERDDTETPLDLFGDNSLPPGTYYVSSKHSSDHPDVLLTPEKIDVASGITQTVTVKQLSHVPWLFPRLPEQAGAYMAGGGTLWMKGMPDDARLPYGLQLTMGAEGEFVDATGKKVTGRWMEVVVTTHGPRVKYVETGRLLVDIDEYRRKPHLSVKGGLLTGESNSIESRLRYLFPKEPPRRLAAKFDATKDAIGDRAEELTVILPAARISVQDALNLLFGAEFDSSSKLSGVRSQLAQGSDRNGARELIPGGPGGALFCLAVKSDTGFKPNQKGKGYSFYRHEAVPFSVVQIDANVPDQFRAGFKLTGYGSDAGRSEEAAKEAEVEAFKDRKPAGVRFDQASFPDGEGALAKYTVAISRGGLPEQIFKVHLRMADALKPGESGRWLEVMVKGGADFEEEALLRVEDEREIGGVFSIKEGWIRSQDEIFRFEPKGDRGPLELGLLKLGKKPVDSQLTIHDVLALLFGAQLTDKDSAEIEMLRGLVAIKLKQIDQKRALSYEDPDGGKPIMLFDKTRISGEVWTVPATKLLPLSYRISRSRQLPFDFSSVVFSMTNKFELTADLELFKHSRSPSLLSVTAAGAPSLADATASRVKAAEKDANWRKWTWSDAANPEREWAEFRGQLKNDIVLLKCKRDLGEDEIREVQFEDLCEDDQKWIRVGRTWNATDFKERAPYVRRVQSLKEGTYIKVKYEGKEPKIPFKDLSKEDQAWVDDLEKAMKDPKNKGARTQVKRGPIAAGREIAPSARQLLPPVQTVQPLVTGSEIAPSARLRVEPAPVLKLESQIQPLLFQVGILLGQRPALIDNAEHLLRRFGTKKDAAAAGSKK